MSSQLTLRDRVLRLIASEHLNITGIKAKFQPQNRREVHHALHDLEYEGTVKLGWDWLYRMSDQKAP